MTRTKTHQSDATRHAAAIAQWDDEGGAAAHFPEGTGAKVQINRRFRRMIGVPAALKVDQALAEEEQILECLGAAVILRWGTLPTKIQRELFDDASSLADLTQSAELKGQIARFLHNSRNEGWDVTTQKSAGCPNR